MLIKIKFMQIRRKPSIVLISVILLSFFLTIFVNDLYSDMVSKRSIVHNDDTGKSPTDEEKIQYAIVACRDENVAKHSKRNNWDHQLRQMSVLLKSAAVLSSRPIHFNVVASSKGVYEDILNITRKWPEHYRKQVIFNQYREVYYPSGLEHMINMFTVCSTVRLFLPQIFKELDSLIFVDTDTMFMQPPDDLWMNFRYFEDRQGIGVTPCFYMYNEAWKKDIPSYGDSGLNAGVLLMNVTRIQNFPGGWVDTVKTVIEKYKGHLPMGDQDILNVMLSKKNSVFAYEVPCEWNYRLKVCSLDRNRCPTAPKNGVGLFHGCAETFVNNEAPRIKAIFQSWDKYDLNAPLEELLSSMETAVRGVNSNRGCSKISNIEGILLNGLRKTLCTKYQVC